ncbi:MAG: hypothetical protein P4L31_00650 [Candidatus Babeliales bacterium]|nr:hypothetical protein [Candidatus Babeliales bacterium]
MKHRILLLLWCGALVTCAGLYSSVPQSPRLADLEENRIDDLQIDHPDSHAALAQKIQKAGLNAPEECLIRNLNYCMREEPADFKALKSSLVATKKKAIDTQDGTVGGYASHLLKFASGAINAEINGNKVRAKKDCMKLLGTCAVAGISVVGNIALLYLNSQK